ncbi:MAG: hypothetical protein WC582_04195 [Patescibacteria group bacterium]
MTTICFYSWLFKIFVFFILSVLLIFFKGAFSEKFISWKELSISFLKIFFLAAYYLAWLSGRISFSKFDWPVVITIAVLLIVYSISRKVKILLSQATLKRPS